jgi:Flp pilus assembly protein TadG
MRIRLKKSQILRDQRGATAIVVAISLVLLISCAALAIDMGHLYVARNQLQNAADAGALAGARFLYTAECGASNINTNGFTDCDTGQVRSSTNQIAHDAARANMSEGTAVEVNWSPGQNTGSDVERGHWSFATGEFTPNDTTALIPLWNVNFNDLDVNTDFINAVRVVTRRSTQPVSSFFARIFGREGFEVWTEAIGYIGFSAGIGKGEVELPIVICQQSIQEGQGEYSGCNMGRMLNSGSNDATHNTAGWTNFDLADSCGDIHTADANAMRALICGPDESPAIDFAKTPLVGTTGGVQQVTFTDMRDCWIGASVDTDDDDVLDTSITDPNLTSPMFPAGMPVMPWGMKLPVVDCPGNNVSNCSELVGVVHITLLWMTYGGTPKYVDAPKQMYEQESTTNSWNPADEIMTIDLLVPNGGYEYDPVVWNGATPPVGQVFDYPQIVAHLSPAWLGAQVKDLNGDTIITADEVQLSQETAAREEAGKVRWASFVDHFKLKNVDNQPAPYAKKSMYFLPSCKDEKITGPTGGGVFGILAEIPVLVE